MPWRKTGRRIGLTTEILIQYPLYKGNTANEIANAQEYGESK